LREILSAFFAAKLFGTISQKTRIRKVMSHVARPIASDSSIHEEAARVIEICVASAAAYTFTRLLPTRIVISNLSVCDFICARAFEPKSFCFTRESSL